MNPGLRHMILAAALVVLFVTSGRLRWIYLAGAVALVATQFVATHIVIKPDDFERLNPVNITFARIFVAWFFGTATVQLLRTRRAPQGGSLTKAIDRPTILVWVVAGAAGRWIAFA